MDKKTISNDLGRNSPDSGEKFPTHDRAAEKEARRLEKEGRKSAVPCDLPADRYRLIRGHLLEWY